MRILYINPVAGLGGAEQCLLDTLIATRQSLPKAEIYLLVLGEGNLIEKADFLGINVTCLPLPSELAKIGDSQLNQAKKLNFISSLFQSLNILNYLTKYVKNLRTTIEEINPDLIYSNGFKTHLLTSLTHPSVPVIWHIHDFVSSRQIVRHLLRWRAKSVTMAIANSQAVAEDVQKVLPKVPVKVVYNCIDLDYFSPQESQGEWLDTSAGLPLLAQPPIRIGLIATYAKWKGQDIFLEAAALILKNQYPRPIRFYIIGDRIYHTQGSQFSRAELENQAKSLGIKESIGFIGFQNNIVEAYRALDIVVHASTQPEPFGRTIVEAMACSKPVIVSQAGGAIELFTHNQDAVGVPPGNAIALADAIATLINNPQHRQYLASNARQTVFRKFNRNSLGQQLNNIYSRVLSGKC